MTYSALLQVTFVQPQSELLLLLMLRLRGSQVSRVVCCVYLALHLGVLVLYISRLPHSRLTEIAPDLVGTWAAFKENRLIENLLADEFAPAADGGSSCSPAAPLFAAVPLWLYARPPILPSTFFMAMRRKK